MQTSVLLHYPDFQHPGHRRSALSMQILSETFRILWSSFSNQCLNLIISSVVPDSDACQHHIKCKKKKKKIDCDVCSMIINSILHQPKFVSLRPGQSRNWGWIDAFILVGGATFFSTHYFEGPSGSGTMRPVVTLQSEFSSLSAAAACAHHAGGICAVWLSFKDLQRLPAAQPDGETTSKPREIKSIILPPLHLQKRTLG